jgi:hypothetical protein
MRGYCSFQGRTFWSWAAGRSSTSSHASFATQCTMGAREPAAFRAEHGIEVTPMLYPERAPWDLLVRMTGIRGARNAAYSAYPRPDDL